MRKRSAYRPKYLPGSLPMTFRLPSHLRTDLQLPPLGMLEAFKEGTGTEEGANTIAAAVNLCAVLAREESEEVQAVAAAGLDAIRAVMERGKGGKWGVSGGEYRAIGESLALCADMQEVRTRREMGKAIRTTMEEAAV